MLRTALKARSFNKELVLVANSLQKVGGLVQLVSNFESLGYGHLLLLSYSQGDCEGLVTLLPQMGCAWTRFSFGKDVGVGARYILWFLRCVSLSYHHVQHNTCLYCTGTVQASSSCPLDYPHMSSVPVSGLLKALAFYSAACLQCRYRTLVRAVRLGYNVLMTDNDVVMFDDPYAYFKAPPFSHFTVLNQQEWPDTHEPNGGFIYIQNARPNGPAVWLFTEVWV